MYRSIILPEAYQDIKDIAKWYNDKKKGLGKKFAVEVKKKVHFIRQYPKSYGIHYFDVRTVLTDVFPFLIHYYIDETIKSVVVFAVLHTSRNPDIWLKRQGKLLS